MSTYTVGCSLQVAANGQQPAKFNNIIGTANDIALTENGVREMTIGTDSGLIKSYVKSVVRNLTVKTGGSPRFTILAVPLPIRTGVAIDKVPNRLRNIVSVDVAANLDFEGDIS